MTSDGWLLLITYITGSNLLFLLITLGEVASSLFNNQVGHPMGHGHIQYLGHMPYHMGTCDDNTPPPHKEKDKNPPGAAQRPGGEGLGGVAPRARDRVITR